ncbi:MAG: chemotaxis-specific protein-glutamate methyltransferase CheB [Candidatus Hydrogenedentes bacterium]|nr:chemotaxis-specific protein-glutamate methyltransferase CheB [Candidatus Hydrogenedentota bacterium]
MVSILIVDDTLVVRELLSYILGSTPGVTIAGTAANGREALEAIATLRPDIVTMDINMPGMNGFETTRRIMETCPLPIIIVSGSWKTDEVATTFRALEAGAVAVVARPPGIGHPDHKYAAAELVQTVLAMAEVRVVRRWPRAAAQTPTTFQPDRPTAPASRKQIDMVAVGASTGGPVVIQSFLKSLPENFSIPILIVQHMAGGFIQGFVEWLAHTCGRPVLLGGHGAFLVRGHAYVAPDGHQMGVDACGRLRLGAPEPENGFAPSVSYLFRSVAEVYGLRSAAILLSGMGIDGAAELKHLNDIGALTFAQDEESAVIYGMPGEAKRLGAAQYILPPQKIATTLASLSQP